MAMFNMQGTGNPLSTEQQGPMDLGGLPPEFLYALVELLAGLQKQEMPPQQSMQSQGMQPGELEQLMQMFQQPQQQPRQPLQVDPAMLRDLVNRGGNPWGQVEPGK
jgi:hypothetical protein